MPKKTVTTSRTAQKTKHMKKSNAKIVKSKKTNTASKKPTKSKEKLVLIKRPSYKNAPVATWHKKLPPKRPGPLSREQV